LMKASLKYFPMTLISPYNSKCRRIYETSFSHYKSILLNNDELSSPSSTVIGIFLLKRGVNDSENGVRPSDQNYPENFQFLRMSYRNGYPLSLLADS
jgi:hypothetical protein